jgi:hypothetical protein
VESDTASFEDPIFGSSGISYDPNVIRGYANALYRRADFIVLIWTIAGALLGAALFSLYDQKVGPILGLMIGGIVGSFEGQSRSFLLRLQAQLALCQVQIEANTRKAS